MKILKPQTRIGPPQKCYGYESERMVFPCWGQFKLDGLRARYADFHFYSGDKDKDLQWNDAVVEHLLSPLRKLNKKYRLDGEFYRHGWKTQQINSAIAAKRVAPNDQTGEVFFCVFDTLDTTKPFYKRIMDAISAVKLVNHPAIRKVDNCFIRDQLAADKFYRSAISKGYEGVVYRLPHTPNEKRVDEGYISGRVPWMLKRKELFDAEFKIVDITEGRMTDKGGKHVGRLGALVCKTKDGKLFNVGSGYSDDERQLLYDNPPIGELLRVEFRAKSEDGVPLEPRAIGIRNYD